MIVVTSCEGLREMRADFVAEIRKAHTKKREWPPRSVRPTGRPSSAVVLLDTGKEGQCLMGA